MSIPICDVLQLNSLKNCTVIAGASGQWNTVDSIGIIDHFDVIRQNYQLFHSRYLLGKLLLSVNFISFKPEQQSECLRFLSDSGASGIVIFQTDLFHGTVAEDTCELANALSFPILQAPEQYYNYSDIITDVIQAVTSKSMSISPVLKCLTSISRENPSMDALLTIITENTNLYVGLYDWNLERIYLSAPNGLLDSPQYLRALNAQLVPGTFEDGENRYYFTRRRLACSDDILSYAVIISKDRPVAESLCQQVVDLIQLFSFTRYKHTSNRLSVGHALLAGDLLSAKRHAKNLQISIEGLRYLVICHLPSSLQKDDALPVFTAWKDFCKQNGVDAITDFFEGGLAIFLKAPTVESELAELLEQFSQYLEEPAPQTASYFFITVLNDLSSANEIFTDCIHYADSMERLFPRKRVFTHKQKLFAQNLIRSVQTSSETGGYCSTMLDPLNVSQARQLELVKTLSVLLLDANGSVDLAAGMLYLHKSTVKYRIGRACELLDFDIRKMPDSCHLYLALAAARLLE